MPKKFVKRIAVRFVGEHDEKIYNQLTKSADKNHRSINGEVIRILEEHYAKESETEQKTK